MAQFDFSRLIKKYNTSPSYIQIENAGYYDYGNGGVWVPGVTSMILIDGAVIPLNGQGLIFGESGTYTSDDKKLYCYSDFKNGSTVKYKDVLYTISQKIDYSDYSGVFVYILKRGAV